MTEQEARKFLEIIATNLLGDSVSEKNEKLRELMLKEYDAINVAIEALEKQIPKKVVENRWIYTRCDCGYEFSVHHGDGYYSIPYEQKINYCPNCGQKIDWGE